VQNELYFADSPIVFPSAKKASHDMAITCFVYLSFQEFELERIQKFVQDNETRYIPKSKLALDGYPLLKFAAENWPPFVRGADTYVSKSENLWEAFSCMSQSTSRLNSIFSLSRFWGPYDYEACRFPKGTNPLGLVTHHGLYELLLKILKQGHKTNINAQCHDYKSALEIAALQGHVTITNYLIEQGANVNTERGEYGTALQAAAYDGNEDIVRILIENRADANARGGEHGTALQAACISLKGNEAIVRILIKKGADVNARGGKYGSALKAAARRHNQAVVRILKEKGADGNAQGGENRSALSMEKPFRGQDSCQLLIENSAIDNHSRNQSPPRKVSLLKKKFRR
jgi:hypothetical protein